MVPPGFPPAHHFVIGTTAVRSPLPVTTTAGGPPVTRISRGSRLSTCPPLDAVRHAAAQATCHERALPRWPGDTGTWREGLATGCTMGRRYRVAVGVSPSNLRPCHPVPRYRGRPGVPNTRAPPILRRSPIPEPRDCAGGEATILRLSSWAPDRRRRLQAASRAAAGTDQARGSAARSLSAGWARCGTSERCVGSAWPSAPTLSPCPADMPGYPEESPRWDARPGRTAHTRQNPRPERSRPVLPRK
jgi:hypothetical protein